LARQRALSHHARLQPKASVVNVSCLIAWAGNLLDAGGADLATVIA
jgi:hypothetical protein